MTTTAPFGSWTSPITAAALAAGEHPVEGGTWVGDEVWWLERRPSENGRLAVRTQGPDGEPVDVLPAPWSARTRVHEYGGGSWFVTPDRTLVFTEFSDQRLYRLDPGSQEPTPLTPATGSFRFGEIQLHVVDGHSEVVAVRETHDETDPSPSALTRDIVAVPLDGSAADDAGAIRSIVSGSHFLAYPRFSPDGTRLAWIAWEHPQMPWDGTELRVGTLVADGGGAQELGTVSSWKVLAGSETESVLQPTWHGDSLLVTADRTGWWNLERVDLDGTRTPLHPEAAEYGGPLWTLGMAWYRVLGDGRILAVRTLGSDRLELIDPATGDATPIDLPLTAIGVGAVNGDRVLVSGGSSTLQSGLRVLDLGSGELTDVRLEVDDFPSADYLPGAREETFPSVDGRVVHAIVHPPHNAEFTAPEGELPPYVAFVHGGPTGRTTAPRDLLTKAYFTSRGIGVVDINYGGSAGYGRAYRDALKLQWGVVDVEDTVAAVRGLADAGLADGARLAIRGGSAGGWTVLASLTSSDVFAAGVSYFGVAELTKFAQDTHDFESRYLDGLIGPLPEAAELYETRAPVNNTAGLTTPVLLLQGLDDPIVPPSQAEMFRDALVAGGIRHAYVAYEGESHGFRKEATIIHATEAELSFYGQILGFEPAGVPVLPLS
ncbi:S9 family peptidase [Frondihabitans australicus]|uniref:Dipeptidyl aminopeptidase/acylaminoacyl peptidase n=1 Tax=Frondihabitans australicus TaxID=386892 RepID=A0A495ILF7_9MICO|nr:prolyl oligopeptidase family serine peptidase [Frondihabitans australicus]RKR76560.1 dipeptidyl aminopeptidase/acylaminoacyl peptidase [Frondihabitans australicus]